MDQGISRPPKGTAVEGFQGHGMRRSVNMGRLGQHLPRVCLLHISMNHDTQINRPIYTFMSGVTETKDMAKVGGPLSVVKVCTSMLCPKIWYR